MFLTEITLETKWFSDINAEMIFIAKLKRDYVKEILVKCFCYFRAINLGLNKEEQMIISIFIHIQEVPTWINYS